MRIISISLLLSAILFLACCHQPKPDENLSAISKIRIEWDKDSVHAIGIKGAPEIVALGDVTGGGIVNITKLYAGNDHYVILDKVSNAIYIYDKSGRFQHKIGGDNNYRESYGAITDAVYYPRTDRIEVFHIQKRIMIEYSVAGEKIAEKRSPFFFISFYKTNEGYWVYGCFDENLPRRFYNPEGNRYNLLLLSADLREIKGRFCKSRNFYDRTDGNDNFLTNSRGELFFRYGFNDVLYKIIDERATPYLRFDFGAAQLPYEYLSTISNNKEFLSLLYDQEIRYNGFKYRFMLGDRLISFGCSPYEIGASDQRNVMCFWDSLHSKSADYPDTSYSPALQNTPVAIQNSKIFYVIIPSLLEDQQIKKINDKYKMHLTANTNPLLIINDEKNVF